MAPIVLQNPAARQSCSNYAAACNQASSRPFPISHDPYHTSVVRCFSMKAKKIDPPSNVCLPRWIQSLLTEP